LTDPKIIKAAKIRRQTNGVYLAGLWMMSVPGIGEGELGLGSGSKWVSCGTWL